MPFLSARYRNFKRTRALFGDTFHFCCCVAKKYLFKRQAGLMSSSKPSFSRSLQSAFFSSAIIQNASLRQRNVGNHFQNSTGNPLRLDDGQKSFGN